MLTISARKRKIIGGGVEKLREEGVLPAILYGPDIENISLEIDLKEFENILEEAGESTMIELKVRGVSDPFSVLIKDVSRDPVNGNILHADFYQPKAGEEIEAVLPLVFEGEAPAAEELGGVLVKNISEIDVKSLPGNLPKEVVVDVSPLKTFDDVIQVKDINVPEGVHVLKEPEEVVALVTAPEKEPEKKIEEKEEILGVVEGEEEREEKAEEGIEEETGKEEE